MKLIATGPIDGQIIDFYNNLTDKKINWILSTGNFGIWPDLAKINRVTRLKGKNQDFAKLYLKGFQAPISTLFVAGVHEDHRWLEQRKSITDGLEILGEVNWLMNGYKTTIGDMTKTLNITGLGKVYSEATFNGKFNKKSYRHYTRRELEKGCASGPTDILLLHQEPEKPIKTLIYATRPKLIIHSSEEFKQYNLINIPTIGLPKSKIINIYYDGNTFKIG